MKMFVLVTSKTFLLHRPVSEGREEWVLIKGDTEQIQTHASGVLQSALWRLLAQFVPAFLCSRAFHGSFLHDCLVNILVC